MEVIHCKDCIYYNVHSKRKKKCEIFGGLSNSNESDFCSYASTEDNENAGLDCNYQGVRCKDCVYYKAVDGNKFGRCLYAENIPKLGVKYAGLCKPYQHDYCSRAESIRKIQSDDEANNLRFKGR